MHEPVGQDKAAPVRVVRLELPDPTLAERLCGPGIGVTACEVVFHTMLPSPPEATLQAVMSHGLVLVFEPPLEGTAGQPTGLVVPWAQVAYLRFVRA